MWALMLATTLSATLKTTRILDLNLRKAMLPMAVGKTD
jgi:hypothetical protein